MHEQYDMLPLVAYVRGYAMRTGDPHLAKALQTKPLSALSAQEEDTIFHAGKAAGLKLYRFKRTHDTLPRVKRVLGILRGLSPKTLLDVGSGRGVFLLPFLAAFPDVSVTALDLLDYRVAFLSDIANGGCSHLSVAQGDICTIQIAENAADVVTLLEVLEHIPDVAAAVRAAVRAARQFVIVSVPSKADNNPEHIHLLTKARLTELFSAAGCTNLHFDGVNGHLICVAAIGEEPCILQ